MIKVRIETKKNNNYLTEPRDSSILIQAVYLDDDTKKQYIEPLFNIWPVNKHAKRWYENDRYNITFNTIKEAKHFAADKLWESANYPKIFKKGQTHVKKSL